MTYKLTAIISHKSFDEPLTKEFYYTGDTLEDILSQIDTLPFHRNNLRHYRKTKFKDTRGVKHEWRLETIEHLN